MDIPRARPAVTSREPSYIQWPDEAIFVGYEAYGTSLTIAECWSSDLSVRLRVQREKGRTPRRAARPCVMTHKERVPWGDADQSDDVVGLHGRGEVPGAEGVLVAEYAGPSTTAPRQRHRTFAPAAAAPRSPDGSS